MTDIRHLLTAIFNTDFAKCKNAGEFAKRFFSREITISDLQQVHALVHMATLDIGGKKIDGAIAIGKPTNQSPIAIIAQLHGNEPAGIAGILVAMALAEAGLLKRQIIGVIGNRLAAEQYFYAYAEAPRGRQELRDVYRCGLGEGGILLPDMNRIPLDFMARKPDTEHLKRAQELFHIGQYVGGALDIHSARGNMICITDHKHDRELQFSPIRSVLIGLADAIAAHSSTTTTPVATLKNILAPLPNIEYQIGIEAGRHEDSDTPANAAMFTHAFLHTIGASASPSAMKKENSQFECFHVQPKWTYGDLMASGTFADEDKIFMVMPCISADAIPKRADRVIVRKKDGSYQAQTIMQYIVQPAGKLEFSTYQYDEMEEIKENSVIAVAVPSGVTLKAPATRSGIFFSKSYALYDKDPSVGAWPVLAKNRHEVKFCYPCIVKQEKRLPSS